MFHQNSFCHGQKAARWNSYSQIITGEEWPSEKPLSPLDTTPGITVNDNTQENSEEIAYQTGRTPAETERNRAVAQSTDVQPTFTPLTWFLLANVVIFLMVGGYFAYLKIRR